MTDTKPSNKPSTQVDEPKENQLADIALMVMRKHMPENGTTYLESRMLWGYVWKDMQSEFQKIINLGE